MTTRGAGAPRLSRVGTTGLVFLGAAGIMLAVMLAQRPPMGPRVGTQQLVAGLANPVHLTHAGDRSGRLFVVEQSGVIRVVRDGRVLPVPFLDIRSRVVSGGELGLLSVAFHPGYASNGRLFVNYTSKGRLRTIVAEYRVSRRDANRADNGERVILEVEQPYTNHNGGLNLFGPDGMLYIGMGDGGAGGDPHDHGQRLESLLGKLLRIDVNTGPPYGIPQGNPFLGRAVARDEIWASGLRNPWRFSFDRATGRLFLGDVGQNAWEEIDLIEKGQNYGWRIMEGAHCFTPPTNCETSGLVLPIAEYANGALGCSVTGGIVYRGSRIRDLVGRYLFGDYCSGRVWSLIESPPSRWTMRPLLDTGFRISSFGEDESGEPYIVDHRGSIHRLVAR